MCLLVVSSRCEPGLPLVVGANRDERYDRPAGPLQLRAGRPRVLAGRDEEAGGTWLAVNEHGLVAGLTNQPSEEGHDPSRCTRGALPLLAARHARARDAIGALLDAVDPARYNPCSLLVGDRDDLYSLEVGAGPTVAVRALAPGRYVLENRPLGTRSAKTAHVEAQLDRLPPGLGARRLQTALTALLADHALPEAAPDGDGPSGGEERPANCVHGDRYGTRSSLVVLVGPEQGRLPEVLAADGPPCRTGFEDRSALWGRPAVAS